MFLEIVLAPSFAPEAFEILAQKKNIRLNTKNIIVKNLADMGYEGSVVALFDFWGDISNAQGG